MQFDSSVTMSFMIGPQLNAVLDVLREAAFARNPSGRIVYWNAAATKLYGWSVEEATDMSTDLLIPDEKRIEFREKTERALAGESGTPFLTQRKTRLNGKFPAWVQMLPLISDGRVELILELSRRKKHSRKSSEYRQLAQNIAHELRSPLSSLRNIAYLLDESGVERQARVMKRQIAHCENVLENLLIWSGVKQKRSREIALSEIVQDIREMEVIPNSVTFDTKNMSDVFLSADPVEMRQVMLNLITNSVEALENVSGRVSIAAERVGETVRIEVSDDGPGIPEELLTRVFEPLFTTKKSGIGLGLYIAKQLVEENGGTIRVERLPGHGSRFVVEIPILEDRKLL